MSQPTPAAKHEVLQVVMQSFGTFARNAAKFMETLALEQEALEKAGMKLSDLNDSAFVTKLMDDLPPEMVGRYVRYTIRIADTVKATGDISKLSLEDKKKAAKDYIALAEDIEALGREIGKLR
jgi:phenylacetate-coenzyme A ligase PaaK-like adenylate-forming protein